MLYSELLKHYISAHTLHGTHSPFVYQLYSEVFANDRTDLQIFQQIEDQRKLLLRNQRIICFKDFGAKGSPEGIERRVSVKSIAKKSLKQAKWGRAFHRLIAYFEFSEVIELGTSLGITTSYMASVYHKPQVLTLDGAEAILKVANRTWENLKLENISSFKGNIDTTLASVLDKQESIQLVFIDANHSKEATIRYFELLLIQCNESSILVFDDIYWSKGMKEAWEYIKLHPRTRQTLDFFEVGIVLFRTNQEREHFRLRY